MLSGDDLQILNSVLKPSILNTIMQFEEILTDIELEDYDQSIVSVINEDRDEPAQHGLDIENVFSSLALELLKRMGVELNIGAVSLYPLVKIIEVLHTVLEPENAEMLDAISETSETGQEFLINCMVEYTLSPMGYWLNIIDDYDASTIRNTKKILRLELSESEIVRDNVLLERVKAFLVNHSSSMTSIATGFIKARETDAAVGYSFRYAFMTVFSQLEYYTMSEANNERLALELITLALGSSLTHESITGEIYEVLEILDLQPLHLSNIMAIVHKVLS